MSASQRDTRRCPMRVKLWRTAVGLAALLKINGEHFYICRLLIKIQQLQRFLRQFPKKEVDAYFWTLRRNSQKLASFRFVFPLFAFYLLFAHAGFIVVHVFLQDSTSRLHLLPALGWTSWWEIQSYKDQVWHIIRLYLTGVRNLPWVQCSVTILLSSRPWLSLTAAPFLCRAPWESRSWTSWWEPRKPGSTSLRWGTRLQPPT